MNFRAVEPEVAMTFALLDTSIMRDGRMTSQKWSNLDSKFCA